MARLFDRGGAAGGQEPLPVTFVLGSEVVQLRLGDLAGDDPHPALGPRPSVRSAHAHQPRPAGVRDEPDGRVGRGVGFLSLHSSSSSVVRGASGSSKRLVADVRTRARGGRLGGVLTDEFGHRRPSLQRAAEESRVAIPACT